MNVLLDKEFIEALDKNNEREVYARIISLTMDECPIEEITGKVSQGTLSIDGTSAVRRTCSLTIISDRVDINEYYWGFTTKFKLDIGLKIPPDIKNQHELGMTLSGEDSATGHFFLNGELVYPYEAYPDIVWFPQGTFLITDFKLTINANSTDNIYITGKDKMCLINGDIGGHFPHATDLGKIDTYTYDNDGKVVDHIVKDLTIKEIIREMIHKYANEPLHNIIVKDLDQTGLELLDYEGQNDIYFFKSVQSGLFENVVFDGDIIRYDSSNHEVIIKNLTDMELDTFSSNYISKSAKKIKNSDSIFDQTYYTVVKSSYGSVVGYRVTDLTYPGDLIANVGDTVTSMLDKLVKMLGDYEYFYDLQGRFIFQRKLIYINTSWNSTTQTSQETKATYTNYVNIKKSHLTEELAVNKEPTVTQLEETYYNESMKVISQIQYSFVGGLTITTFNNTPNISNVRNDYAIWGKQKSNSNGKDNLIHLRCAIDVKPSKYKAWDGTIYTSDKWDWRELIYQMGLDYLEHNHDDDYEVVLYNNNPDYKFGRTGYEQYYEDLIEFWRYLYNPESNDNITYFLTTNDETKYWRRDIFMNPAVLKFWFDFLDAPGSNLDKYSVKAIGDRTKTVNDNNIKAIYYGEIPNIIFITQEKYQELKASKMLNDGYTYILLPPAMEEYFVVSRKSKSAQDELDDLVYQHAYCNESITITTMPIYHLEPNVKISVVDEKSKIDGEYVINKITLPLNYNGMMQIMATRAPIRLF